MLIGDIEIHLPGILLAYSILTIGIFSPGPAVMAIIGTSLEKGKVPGLYLAFGVVCGSGVWAIIAVVGMASLLVKFAYVLTLVKILGGMFLLWLGYRNLRSAFSSDKMVKPISETERSITRMWMTGFLIHLGNPKAALAWMATIALGVTATSPIWVSVVIVMGGMTISLIGNLSYALVFSTDRAARIYLRARKPIELLLAGVFGLAGTRLILSRD